MSLFGTMNTSVSGMNAQANRFSAVGDNIANADTTGYKRSSISFSDLLQPSVGYSYDSGSVLSNVRHDIETQGGAKTTGISSNMMIQGDGFFIVEGMNGEKFMTRNGSFQPDDKGNLVNDSGFKLMGYSYSSGVPASQVNGLTGLDEINMANHQMKASATKNVKFVANLDARERAKTGDTPVDNLATSEYSSKTSVTTHDSLGREVKYDVYFTKIHDATREVPAQGATALVPATNDQWEVTIYRADKATNGGFPYTQAALVTSNTGTLEFDAVTGKITGNTTSLSVVDKTNNPTNTIKFDLTALTQQASTFAPQAPEVDGSAAMDIKNADIGKDGVLYGVYPNGSRIPLYRIPLATVAAVNNLTPESGGVFTANDKSGIITTGFPGEGYFGQTVAGMVEGSNVDLAQELTEMIQAQRSYTANSKVFQTGSDLMDVLVNLKR